MQPPCKSKRSKVLMALRAKALFVVPAMALQCAVGRPRAAADSPASCAETVALPEKAGVSGCSLGPRLNSQSPKNCVGVENPGPWHSKQEHVVALGMKVPVPQHFMIAQPSSSGVHT